MKSLGLVFALPTLTGKGATVVASLHPKVLVVGVLQCKMSGVIKT